MLLLKSLCDSEKYKDIEYNIDRNILFHRDYKGNEIIFYCTKCKKIIKKTKEKKFLNFSNYIKPMYFAKNQENEPNYSYKYKNEYITCPKCYRSERLNELITDRNLYIRYINCFLNKNKLNLVIEIIKYVYIKEKDNFIPEITKIRIIFNLDTGFTYELPRIVNGKIRKYRGKKNRRKEHITLLKANEKNIGSYFSTIRFHYSEIISKNCLTLKQVYLKAYNIIREYKMNKLDCYIKTYEEQNDDLLITDFYSLIKFNRYPTLDLVSNDYSIIGKKSFKNFLKETKTITLYKNIKHDMNNLGKSPIKEILNKYDLKYKKKLNILMSHSRYIYLYIFFEKKVKFKYDNIIKLINFFIKTKANEYELLDVSFFLYTIKNQKNFNENNFVKKIITCNLKYPYGMIQDLIISYNAIKKHNKNYELSCHGSLEDIHDKVSEDYREIKYKNIGLEYENNMLKLNDTINEYTFTLAKDTKELSTIGKDMQICVGSYRERALSKSCYIVDVKDKNNKYKACIEIREDKISIKQVKLFANNRISTYIKGNKLNEENSNLYNAIKEWINKNKLISCTSDLPKEYNDLLLKTKKELYDEYLKYWDLKEVSYFAW